MRFAVLIYLSTVISLATFPSAATAFDWAALQNGAWQTGEYYDDLFLHNDIESLSITPQRIDLDTSEADAYYRYRILAETDIAALLFVSGHDNFSAPDDASSDFFGGYMIVCHNQPSRVFIYSYIVNRGDDTDLDFSMIDAPDKARRYLAGQSYDIDIATFTGCEDQLKAPWHWSEYRRPEALFDWQILRAHPWHSLSPDSEKATLTFDPENFTARIDNSRAAMTFNFVPVEEGPRAVAILKRAWPRNARVSRDQFEIICWDETGLNTYTHPDWRVEGASADPSDDRNTLYDDAPGDIRKVFITLQQQQAQKTGSYIRAVRMADLTTCPDPTRDGLPFSEWRRAQWRAADR